MSPKNALIVVAAIAISIVAILIGWKLGQDRRTTEPIVAEAITPDFDLDDVETAPIDLYFPGTGGRLHVEQRSDRRRR